MDTKDTIIAVIFVTFRIFCDTYVMGLSPFPYQTWRIMLFLAGGPRPRH